MTHLHIHVPAMTRGTLARTHELKNEQERQKKRGGEKGKSKSQDCCVTFLLSAHARTSQADILHLDQKAMKCMTGKQVCGKF